MGDCDWPECKRDGVSQSIIVDETGTEEFLIFCQHHIDYLLKPYRKWNYAKN